MQAYGKTKRHGKLHPHNKCAICSEQKISKKTARQKATVAIRDDVVEVEMEVLNEQNTAS